MTGNGLQRRFNDTLITHPNPIEVEVRQESAISVTWRVYATAAKYRTTPLRRGGFVLGGTKQQAIQDALALEAEGDFVFKRPADMPDVTT